MGRRPMRSSSSICDLKTGDVVWAPYRRFPEWPALVRCVYPKKVTYTFLPIDESSNLKSSIFSCPPHKLRLLTGHESLPMGAKNDMKEAYKAAIEILKKNGLLSEDHQMSELPVFKTSEINKQSVLGDLMKKTKKESDAASSGDTASNASAPHVWGIGEVVWLNTPNHSEWPVVIRELKKRFAMVDAFPLKFNCKPERYPLSACQKFDLTGRNLEAAIRKERNCELRMALQSVMKYFKRRERINNLEKSDSEDDGSTKVDVGNDTRQERDGKTKSVTGMDEKVESVEVGAEVKSVGTLKGNEKREGRRHGGKSPSPISKRQKFSDVMKDLETELSEKLENLDRGDLAWINRARSGRIVKWPILVLKVDNVNKSCVCTELPLDDMSANAEWCLNSEKTRVVQLKNIYLYDTVEAKINEIEDEELKAAIQQADEIAEGSYRPFDDDQSSFDNNNGSSSIRENGCRAASSNVLAPKEILRLCKSEMCARHLMAIWTGQFTCTRHASYEPPPLAPLHFEIRIGDLLPEADAIALVEHLDATVCKFKDAMKSSLRRLHYVTVVALPEAIIFAITQIRYCSGSEANEIFENAVLKSDVKTPSESGEEIGAATGFEQLLKAASKVRCAAL